MITTEIGKFGNLLNILSGKSVSYTHLDVYKRQELGLVKLCIILCVIYSCTMSVEICARARVINVFPAVHDIIIVSL